MYSRQGAKHAKVIWVRTNLKLKFLAGLVPLREETYDFNLAKAPSTQRFSGFKTTQALEVLGDLGAFARGKIWI